MTRQSKVKFIQTLVVILSLLMLSACTSMTSKFTSTMAEDASAFSDQTVTIMAEADLGFGKSDVLYLRQFIDPTQPEELAFFKSEQKALKMLRGMVLYSLELNRIAETYDNEEDKVNAFFELMSTVRDDTQKNMNFTPESYAELLEKIRSESTFRAALLTAQPIINLFGQYLNQVMDEFSGELFGISKALGQRIDKRYAEVIRYQSALEEEKYAVLRGLGESYKFYHSGDKEAYRSLVDSGVILDPDLMPKGTPNKKQMNLITKHLKERLSDMHLIGLEIQPDWDVYRATHKELDEKRLTIRDRITKVRAIALLWVRAHLKMAAGRTQPAEWFDVQDVGGIIKLVL